MGKVRVATIVGARPQFIKSAPVSRALQACGHEEVVLHTGQHYHDHLSAVFFRELELAAPSVNLQIGSGPHGWQTGQMLVRLEEALLQIRPDMVLVYGDTNSTLAGALAAAKLRIPLHHVEAGLRSFNRAMPEEHNRVLTDHCSDVLYCPTRGAVANLRNEGIEHEVHLVGDTMLDALQRFLPIARERSTILRDQGLRPKGYVLATVHRPSNADDPDRLRRVVEALDSLGKPVVIPVHPRTRGQLERIGLTVGTRRGSVKLIEPVGYLDMLALEDGAGLIATDSGGVQKEAYMLKVPCATLRTETEWIETVEAGWNVLVDPASGNLDDAVRSLRPNSYPDLFGDGRASYRIVERFR